VEISSQRIDDIPVIVEWLKQMEIAKCIDQKLKEPHGNHKGLSYGQLGVKVIGHKKFVFIADCKAGSMATRANIAANGGVYCVPVPMSGQHPQYLKQWVRLPTSRNCRDSFTATR
jgi:hypothetical protein